MRTLIYGWVIAVAMALVVSTAPAQAAQAVDDRDKTVKIAPDITVKKTGKDRVGKDVKITAGRTLYLNLWGTELKALAIAIVGVGGAAVVTTCAIGTLPNHLGILVRLLCTMFGTPTVFALARGIVEIWRSDRYIRKDVCYQREINTKWYEPWFPVAHRNCS